ncbi:unnamed protein product, partial [Mesorhabditis belari]|uniref:Dolichyl-diphosphooligosaccharide-protein glycosyltransferase subunit TMEM258 n=1 Tax=Mesorhabditis belari TaxID=2138241 RepID=A0AAF3FU04_9BILA
MDISKMERYHGPVAHSSLGYLTVGLGGLGLFFVALFFVYEVTSTKYSRKITREVLLAAFSALFLGFGTLFLLLWVGIYV